MAGPWEKYQTAPAAAPAGPWAKYATPAAPARAVGEPAADDPEFEGILSDAAMAGLGPVNTPKPSAFRGVKDYASGLNDAARAENEAPDAGLLGVADAALSAITGMISPITGGVEHLVTGKPIEQAAADRTYTPRTAAGRAHLGVLEAVTKPLTESGADIALAPLAAEMQGMHASPKAPKTPKVKAQPSEQAVAARAAGYKLLPSETNGGRVAQAMESIGGSAVKKDFGRVNTAKTTQHAKDEIGAPSLDEKGFAKVREGGDAAYDAMKGIGRVQADDQVRAAVDALKPRTGMRGNAAIGELQSNFSTLLDQPWDAASVVDEVRQLRKEANANSSPPAMGAKPDPKKQSLAQAQIRVANALDDWLERNATTIGSPEIATNYRAARTRLAKTASVERATSGGKTNVRNLEQQDERGVPHSGRLKIAAQTGEFFPESTGAVSGPDIHVAPDSLFGSVKGFAQRNLLGPIISRILQSDAYQNRIGPALEDIGPDSPLGAFYDQPAPKAPYEPFAEAAAPVLPRTSSESMRVANTLAGDLGLAPEGPAIDLPAAPSRMTADVAPAQRGDLNFTPSQPLAADDLAGALGLAPEPTSGGLPYHPAPITDSPLSLLEDAPAQFTQPKAAASLAGDLGVSPEGLTLDAVSPEGPFAYGRGERYSADPREAMPPSTATIQEPGARGYNVSRTVDLASDLGLVPELQTAPDGLARIMPATQRSGNGFGSSSRPEGYEVSVGNDRVAQVPSRSLAEELIQGLDSSPELGDLDSLMSELNQLALRQRPSAATRPRVQNNASGESAASVEAVNRVASEKAAGQNRYLIDKDGTVTPLVGVDAVDAVAKPGQVIVQKGVGAEEFTVLDRGGLSGGAARGVLNAARSSLGE